jgi:type IV pilus assembly protein PilQ
MDEGVRLTFTTSNPMVIGSVEGLPGSDNILIILKAFQPPKPAPEPPQPKVYANGDPLSIKAPVKLQLKDIDAKSVFRMLADIQKFDLILDPSVPDITIPSIVFKDIPFNEAFSYLLRMTDLTYAMVGNTLLIGTSDSVAILKNDQIRRGYQLSYAVDRAGEVRGDLTSALTALVPLSKTPTLDARNRTLFVDASEEQHAQIAELLKKLDQPGRQIMLQTKIVQVRDSATQDLQQMVSGVYDTWLGTFGSSGLRVGYNQSNRNFEEMALNIPIGGGNTGDTVVNIANTTLDSSERTLTAGLNALETADKAKVLAHPSIITLDGTKANINLAENITYASGIDSSGNAEFSTIEVGPNITFTPVIGRDDVVTIEITIDAGDLIGMVPTGFGASTPRTANRHVETLVRVKNGQPFVVGGLYRDNKTSVKNRIPVLGGIPFLGELFTTRNELHDKSEVAMIVIPYILDIPDSDITTFDLQQTSLSK